MLVSSELFKSMLDKIFDVERSSLLNISLKIMNRNNPLFTIDNAIIEMIRISEEFNVNNVADIRMKCLIRTKYVPELISNQNGLYCTLVFEYVDMHTAEVLLDEPPEIYEFNMLAFDIGSLAKSIGIHHINDISSLSDTALSKEEALSILSLEFQLISDDEYNFNKSAFMGLFKQVSMAKVIRYIANAVGVKRIYLVDPDNTSIYNHIYIPPEYWKINVIFDYLQKQYGVYNNGLTYYLSKGILYVYPPFDVNATRKNKLVVLKPPPYTYVGGPNYYIEDENTLTILSNSDVIHNTDSHILSENVGTSQLFVKSDSTIDGQVNYGDSFKFTDTNMIASNGMDNTISDQSASVKYAKPTMNIYQHLSNFARSNTEHIILNWSYARLGKIQPGLPVDFVFDEKDIVMTKTGLVESVIYTITKSSAKGGNSTYAISGVIGLRLDVDQKKYEI